MSCPDVEKLIDLYFGRGDPELESHVQACASCRADLEVLLLLPLAEAAGEEIPDRLVARVREAMPEGVPAEKDAEISVSQRVVAGALGSATVATALVGSGAPAANSVLAFLVISLGAGALAALSHRWYGSWPGRFTAEG